MEANRDKYYEFMREFREEEQELRRQGKPKP